MASAAEAPSPSSPQAGHVARKLRRAWRKERRFHHLRGLCHFVLWAVALVLVDWLVDWLFLIPGPGRLLLLGINIAVLGWVVYHHWLRHLRRYDPVRTALQVERRHGELSSLLVSFVQLGEGEAPQYASPGLVRALRRQAVERTEPLDFREIVSFRELKRIFAFSALVVAFFAAISINWAEHLEVLARRMFDPSARLGYPTDTQIAWLTGDVVLQQGDALILEAEATGQIPDEGSIYVRPQGGSWERLSLERTDGQRFEYRRPQVFQSFAYYIRLGDAESESHRVRVVPPPRLKETVVTLELPDYAGGGRETIEFLNFPAPESSRITWELHTDVALQAAEMIVEEQAPRPMELSDDGTVATIEMEPEEVAQSFSYQFRWTEREHEYVYDEDVRYFVQVDLDQPPLVEIAKPWQDLIATVNKTVAIRYLATDDYGLADAWIVYTVNEGEEQRRRLDSFDPTAPEQQASWALRRSIPGLKVGDQVAFLIEVADNHTGARGAQRGRSQTRRVRILSEQAYLREMFQRTKELIAKIRDMHQDEEEAAREVGTLQREAPPAPSE
ncbi:MAG: hypothetical protein ACLF0G_06605 [Candidatus Brocadiia bacterium]